MEFGGGGAWKIFSPPPLELGSEGGGTSGPIIVHYHVYLLGNVTNTAERSY